MVEASSAANPRRHSNRARGPDLYETPEVATAALLRVERLPHRLWEPACGRGAMVRVLRAAGHDVIASDLIDHGTPITPPGYYQRDFLKEPLPPGCAAIVTNPPYQLAEQFVAHALKLSPLVFMLLRLAFYESERRSGILEDAGLARIHVFRKRLPMMHRDGWTGRRASSAVCFGWYVWDRSHLGPTTIHRLSWRDVASSAAHDGHGPVRQAVGGDDQAG